MRAESTGMTFTLFTKKEEYLSLNHRIFFIIDCRNNGSSKIDLALRSKKLKLECQDFHSDFVL